MNNSTSSISRHASTARPQKSATGCAVRPSRKEQQGLPPYIRGQDLTLVFQGQTLCEHLSFTIPTGGVSVLAANGALCKAALFELLAGKLRPATGRCLIQGHEAHDLPVEIRQRIGVLENTDRMYETMTIGQTAIFFNGCFPGWSNERYNGLIERLGLSRRMKISNLANHQRTLIALIVRLAQDPDLLVLDDWITAFDHNTRDIMYHAIHSFRSDSGKTTLLVGHHAGLTPSLIDHLILIGYSTSVMLPTADLFDEQAALLENRSTPLVCWAEPVQASVAGRIQ